ncbi:DNA or RNA helicase [Mesorhizobium tianshanense]|uniref:Uncharacterized protein n=1 Tax=Mesorhizobium tianshanense TaxID=39844 RepID=A0A562MW79_9HYPH|nr:DNA/RNA helicase [Mesorhizobium tianshanense]TWI24182.1 hypothetical protein IQ26_06322 [Mesorhizobium tianshanense]GLS36253.1 DNA or RNA helicase [Mesorhizobium tianshanense]
MKSQGDKGLQISAGGVKAKYPSGWKDATGQNDAQKYALGQYLQETTATNPWVYRCVMLTGIPELPKDRGRIQPAAGAVAANFDATSLLVAMATVNGIQQQAVGPVISSGDQGTLERILEDPLFRSIVPSSLDRKKMDRIAARPAEAKELATLLGEHRIHLRGHGGTGKTVLLLQSAYEAYLAQGKRSLVLTYNTALAADIQRTLALMSIPSDSEGGGIAVRTVMSFLYSWLNKLGLAPNEEGIFDNYVPRCKEALEYFSAGALGDTEVAGVKAANPLELGFDAILVDEAQDWPQPEADLLVRLYGGNAISLADGIAQLVRGSATNWKDSVANTPNVGRRHLDDGLRMKSNLCAFANAFAEEAGLPWHVGMNQRAPGGRVLVIHGRYDQMPDLQESLLEDALRAGNMPIDMLHCVIPTTVIQDSARRHSLLARAFEAKSWEAWDGVDEIARRNFPRSVTALRVLQYESCRGLEGWTTVLDGLDGFWERKKQEALAGQEAAKGTELPDAARLAEAVAWRWCMIPITRPIDTLAITLHYPSSTVGSLLGRVAKALPDLVEIMA